jgi:hypothetical protein
LPFFFFHFSFFLKIFPDFSPQNILLITQDRNIPEELSITGLAQVAHRFHGSETASTPPPRLRSFCFLSSLDAERNVVTGAKTIS